MKYLSIKAIAPVLLLALTITSCTSINKSMKEPFTRVELQMEDFELSGQVTAEANSTRILGIDFSRLFTVRTGTIESQAVGFTIANIPVVGNIVMDPTANYALYELMKANPGYDVIFYPQYESKVVRPLGIGIFSTSTVKVTARLGKLK